MAASFAARQFAAPRSTAVRVVTWLPFGIFVLLAAVVGWHVPDKTGKLVFVLLMGVAMPLVSALVVLFSWIRGYRLTADTLEVLRVGRTDELPLSGLVAVHADPDAMRRSLKLIGNDGAGAIVGSFRNRKLGRYRAYVTDRRLAVVLQWPDRTVVVSPDRPASFVEEVRRRAGLKG